MKTVINVQLKEKKLKTKFKFKYPINQPIQKVVPTCDCTKYDILKDYIVFTIKTPNEIPFQVTTDKWNKTISPVIYFENGDIHQINIKYYILNP